MSYYVDLTNGIQEVKSLEKIPHPAIPNYSDDGGMETYVITSSSGKKFTVYVDPDQPVTVETKEQAESLYAQMDKTASAFEARMRARARERAAKLS